MSKTINYNINFTAGSSISLSGGTQTLGNLFTTGGNVGIGTTAPSNTLHVVGDLRTTGLITTSNLIATNISTSTLSFAGLSNLPNVVSTNISSTNLVATNITANGIVSLKSTRGILIGTSNDLDNSRIISALDSGMPQNTTRWLTFGQASSQNNQGEIGFNYIGNGNTGNNLVLGLWGLRSMTLRGDGDVGIGTTNPLNTLHVNGDLLVSSFITTSNIICTNLTTNSLSIPVISDVPAINPNMTNTLIIHEDFRGTTLRSGTTSGTTVSYITSATGGYLQLTPSSISQVGYLSWKINPGNAFTIIFDHYAGGGTGADMIAFSWSSDNIQPTNVPTATGYSVEFNELSDIIRLYFNGVVLTTSATITNLDNSTWHRSTITFYRNQIRVIYDGVVVINYTDTVFRNVNGAYMYFYAFTGDSTNLHRIRNIRMSKVNEGLWQYQESTSGNIVYNGGNVGIATTAPAEMLDVRGNLRIGGSTQSNYIMFNGVSGDGSGSGGHTYIGERLWGVSDQSELLLFKGNDIFASTLDRIRLSAPEIRFDAGITGNGTFEAVGTLGSTSMIITTAGNVGIATTAPTEMLDVRGNLRVGGSAQSNYIVFNGVIGDGQVTANRAYIGERLWGGNDRSELLIFKGDDIDPGFGPDRIRLLAPEIRFDTGIGGGGPFETVATLGSAKMIIATSGNVGIGTTDPNFKLEVNGTLYGQTIYTGSPQNKSIILADQGAGGAWAIGANNSAMQYQVMGSHIFYTNSTSGISNAALGTERMRINGSGYVGIGTSNPTTPLHVEGFIPLTLSGGYSYLNRSNPVGTTSAQEGSYSIFASARIAAAEFNAFSDSRIKKNIQDIDDLSALTTLRLIQPKKYNYIDNIRRGEPPVWGFIAQQVESVLDYSTGRITDYIPSVYDIADVTNSENVVTLKLKIKTTNGLISTGTGPIKIKLFTDEKNTIFIATLKEIIDENTFTINESLNETSQVFVYGIEVSDFHTLNKDAIFTVNVAATQELDRELQTLKQNNNELIIRLQDQEKEIKMLKDFIMTKFPGELN